MTLGDDGSEEETDAPSQTSPSLSREEVESANETVSQTLCRIDRTPTDAGANADDPTMGVQTRQAETVPHTVPHNPRLFASLHHIEAAAATPTDAAAAGVDVQTEEATPRNAP